MKKIEYMAPEMEVIKIEYNKMLCASTGDSETPDVPTTPSDEEPKF